MVLINTFVIFDMETTGLPHQEQNRTKATEMCFIAVSRHDLKNTVQGGIISTTKLAFMLNPYMKISPGTVALNGITNSILKHTPGFENRINGINQFLKDLPKPVCLVAHNGNKFDYKILQAECNDVEEMLLEDLLCVDSLPAFRKLDDLYRNQSSQRQAQYLEGMFTDDEEEDDIFNTRRARPINFKLGTVYESLYGCKFAGAHRAEGDCQMLLDCIIAYQSNNVDFVRWADKNCKLLSDIESLDRPESDRYL